MSSKINDASFISERKHQEKERAPDNSIKNRIIQILVDIIIIGVVLAIFACVYTLTSPKIKYFSCDETDVL